MEEVKCPKCNFIRVDGGTECPRCSGKTFPKVNEDEKRTSMQFDEILVPLHQKGIDVVDSCPNGERNEGVCRECNIENCSRTKVFKYRQEVLKAKGESDRE